MKVKDFAKALKTEPSVLLERMQSAGLSHKSESDEITPSDKQALLLFLKDRKSGPTFDLLKKVIVPAYRLELSHQIQIYDSIQQTAFSQEEQMALF